MRTRAAVLGVQQPQVDEVAASELCCGEEAEAGVLDTGCPFGLEPLPLLPKSGEEEYTAPSFLVSSAKDGCALSALEDPALEELAECQEAAGECDRGNLDITGIEEQGGHCRKGRSQF